MILRNTLDSKMTFNYQTYCRDLYPRERRGMPSCLVCKKSFDENMMWWKTCNNDAHSHNFGCRSYSICGTCYKWKNEVYDPCIYIAGLMPAQTPSLFEVASKTLSCKEIQQLGESKTIPPLIYKKLKN